MTRRDRSTWRSRGWWAALHAVVGAACGGDPVAPPPSGPCAGLDVLVAMSDTTAISLSAFGVAGDVTAPVRGADLGNDPQLSVSHGRYFLLARDSDRVFELDAACGRPRAPFSVNDPERRGLTNPQDVAVAPDGSLWIPRFNVPSVAVLDPTGARKDTLDLSTYDADGNPNASAIQILTIDGQAKAFVTLGRLDDRDRFRSKQPSSLLRLDVATGAHEGTLELQGRNPFSTMVLHDEALWATVPGSFEAADELDAGIERIDPRTFTSRLFVRERDLGGSATAVAFTRSCAAAIVADPVEAVNATSVVTFDPETGDVLASASAPILATAGYDLWTLAWRGDVLLVGDRRATPRGYLVHAFEHRGRCDLRPLPDTIFLTAPPVVMRALDDE